MIKVILAATLVLSSLAACGSETPAVKTTPNTVAQSADPGETGMPETEPTSSVLIGKMGKDTLIFPESKLTVFLSLPVKFSPSDTSAGHTAGNKAYKVKVVIESRGSAVFDLSYLTVDTSLGSESTVAESVIDSAQSIEGVPYVNLPPGKKKTFEIAFSGKSDNNHVEVSVGSTFGEVAFFEN